MTFDELEERLDYMTPWGGYNWHGRVIFWPEDPVGVEAIPSPEMVDEIVHAGKSGDEWDGIFVAVLRLSDSRYMTWESFYGPTGNGFSEDAYGGDADVFITKTYEDAIKFGLTDDGRRVLDLTISV